MSKKTLAMVLVVLAVTAAALGYFAMARPQKKQNDSARIDRVIPLNQVKSMPEETAPQPSVSDAGIPPTPGEILSPSSPPSEPSPTPGTMSTPSTDNKASPAPETTSKGGQAIIAFTFDDGYKSDYELAYPLLKKYGIKGTSYIIGKYPDNATPDTLTWAQIKEMYDYGWDFGCHTYSHVNLTKLDNDQIDEEMEKENAAFRNNGLPIPDICAFPYGAYNQQVIDALKPWRKQIRKAFYEEKFVDLQTIDTYAIDCISAEMQAEGRLHSRQKLVDKACEEKAVIVFRVHCMYREKKDDMGRWPVQTNFKMFEQFVDYCVQKGCTFVTMDELMDMYSR